MWSVKMPVYRSLREIPMRAPTAITFVCTFAWILSGCGTDQSTPSEPATEGASAPADMPQTASAPGAAVFIISPADGDTVTTPVEVQFGISGMAIAPAGDSLENSGHHHLLVDTQLAELTQPIPKDSQQIHFGKGQTEAILELEPGTHTLQLILGDSNHIPHIPPVVSNVITITVE
jgi:hypothetical protein